MKQFYIVFTIMLCNIFSYAQITQEVQINHFMVKENLLKNDKLAIIASDSLNNPQEAISGTFSFSVNGFKQELIFSNGVAVCPLQLSKSSFVYIKHINDNGSHGNLYYVLKKDTGLTPYKISWFLMLFIPLLLVMLGYMFRKLIVLFIVILAGFLYFNHNKGLSLPTFFETIFDGLKALF